MEEEFFNRKLIVTALKMLPLLACFFTVTRIEAQAKKQIISGNDDITSSIPDSVKYLYPGFLYGKVFYKDGTSGGSMLNYNLLAGEIQFTTQTGDTLSLANEATLASVTIGKDTFYYDKIYVKTTAGNAKASLGRNEKLVLADIKKAGAFGSYTSSGGVESINSLNTGSRTVHLTENKQMVFVVRNVWFIGDSYHHFLPATKKNVLKMFGKMENINAYLKDHDIDFSKEADLKALIEFAGSQL